MPVTISAEGLSGCTGCEMALLNTGEVFLKLLDRIEILHMPLLMDSKYFGKNEGAGEIDIPKADIGIISGSIRNTEQLLLARKMRERCGLVVAFGTCSAYGGIPALINLYDNEDLFRRYYRTAEATDSASSPAEVVPALLDRTFALDEKIMVDAFIPGCPPHPDSIADALECLIEGKLPETPIQSVCDACPAKREGKGSVQRIKRFLKNARFQSEKPLGEMRCLLEQGLLCIGPVTQAGCSGKHGGAPRCIQARVPCRGCYGPVRRDGNQLLDMLNALASNGIDIKNLPDRLSMLRFSGAHRMLPRQVRRHS